MTAAEIRQSFLDFFDEKGHTIVPSASLMPTAPNLLFTNAGMNPFIPYFLGTEKAPYDPPRAADTQKCIRAGGKHNDLEDVGYDTYHHTFFEMLGNWSFGDYFKKEAIEWAWELLTKRWKVPPARLYATVYRPAPGDPAEFDREAYDHWAAIFEAEGLDPAVHVVDGDKKDNFWMMGETGPCGPCSELHIDLTPEGDTGGALVNKDSAECIEIWNLVFIQYNAEQDGSFRPLPAQHVDTGMGFERVCAIVQGTRGFTDFSRLASNYDTDVFAPLFAHLAEKTGKRYASTLPTGKDRQPADEQEKVDVAFRVIADHIRTLSFAIADGILPGNGKRNYVLRSILRRAVRYGRVLGFGEGDTFMAELLPVLVEQMGDAFPELRARAAKIGEVLASEERAFNERLDKGLRLFEDTAGGIAAGGAFPPDQVVKLWETYGFPVDLTKVLIDERGLGVDEEEVKRLVDKHKATGAAGQSSQVVAAVNIDTDARSEFVGFDQDECEAQVLEVHETPDGVALIVDRSPLYVEKGGQLGDTGTLVDSAGAEQEIVATTGVGDALLVHVAERPADGPVTIKVDAARRRPIEAHHSATHLLHWALHQHVGDEVAQQGSLVAPDRLRFDFNSDALTPGQLAAVEDAVNAKVAEAATVSWKEVPHAEVKERADIMQFFGDKYGERVRVVQIGGDAGALDGYSMELCGGTHVKDTGQIGAFVIKSEGAIAAGTRRIEAACGEAAEAYVAERISALREEAEGFKTKLESANAELGGDAVAAPVSEGDAGAIATWSAYRDALREAAAEADKAVKKAGAARAAAEADAKLGELIAAATGDPPLIAEAFEGSPALLQELLNGTKKHGFGGVAVFTVHDGEKVHLGVTVAKAHTDRFQAGKLLGELAPLIGGKGGGKPEMARGAGGDPSGVEALHAKARELQR